MLESIPNTFPMLSFKPCSLEYTLTIYRVGSETIWRSKPKLLLEFPSLLLARVISVNLNLGKYEGISQLLLNFDIFLLIGKLLISLDFIDFLWKFIKIKRELQRDFKRCKID